MDTISKATHRARLLLPKLERMRGDGRNHDLLQHLALVRNYSDLLSHNHTRIAPEQIANDLIRICDEAEKFMMEVVV